MPLFLGKNSYFNPNINCRNVFKLSRNIWHNPFFKSFFINIIFKIRNLWNLTKLRLKFDRKKQQKQAINKQRTYEILARKARNQTPRDQLISDESPKLNNNNNGSYSNRYKKQEAQNNQNGAPPKPKKRAHFKEDQIRGHNNSKEQQQESADRNNENMLLNNSFYNSYSPLSTPANYRNNNTPARFTDPYGINPLPNIRSPFFSARDSLYPNLESWGVNNASMYDDPFYLSRHSPFLPVYNSIAKAQKVIILLFSEKNLSNIVSLYSDF